MTLPVVDAERLSKTYHIPRADVRRLRDYLRRPVGGPAQRRRMAVRALDGVSFRVDEGEVFGIIGRNGAGKSTLLKILSRITNPSGGRVRIAGRVASLLEVGTGFHPELTGRENVYLNGMLLGMRSGEVDRAFDGICDFAGIGAYINVPIKRYSSGMQLRLAFAVAAHLAADTMIIDEVLAVGDAEFQRKCLGAMRDVSRAGRTALFVSHNMSAVESLCTRVMWLDEGRVRRVGAPAEVIQEYLSAGLGPTTATAPASLDVSALSRGWTLGGARLDTVSFIREAGLPTRAPWHVAFGEPFRITVSFGLDRPSPDVVVGIGVRNARGEDVLTSHSCDAGVTLPAGARRGAATVRLAQPWLRPGAYHLEIAVLSAFQVLDHVTDVATIVVDEQAADGAPPLGIKKGAVAPVWEWTLA